MAVYDPPSAVFPLTSDGLPKSGNKKAQKDRI
jgi:hypothetical protein